MMIDFDFDIELILEDDFIRLTPLNTSHTDELIEIAIDPELWTHSYEKVFSMKGLQQYFESALHKRSKKSEYPFAIFDKKSRAYVGSTRYCDFQPPLDAIRIGYTWIGKSYQGTYINKRAKYLMLEYAFELMQVERIGMGAYASNKVSLAAMESIGLRREGVLRSMFPSPGSTQRIDAVMLSILKDEWYSYAKAELRDKISSINK